MERMTPQAIAAAARAEAERMRSAVAQLTPGGTVRMSREQFVIFANLIDKLCELGAGRSDPFDAPIDGIRWWVPLPEHQRVVSQLEEARLQPFGAEPNLPVISLN